VPEVGPSGIAAQRAIHLGTDSSTDSRAIRINFNRSDSRFVVDYAIIVVQICITEAPRKHFAVHY